MKALIGLGNPDVRYKFTRHNTGFLIMDKILERKKITLENKFNSFFGKSGDVLYLLPKTYMNLSGNAVIELVNFYKLKNEDILVIYDDATIAFGTFRLRQKGSFGGHNGIKSIINRLGSETFDRLKVGVGPVPDNIPIDKYVLDNFSKDELEGIQKMGDAAFELTECWISEGFNKTQAKYSGKVI